MQHGCSNFIGFGHPTERNAAVGQAAVAAAGALDFAIDGGCCEPRQHRVDPDPERQAVAGKFSGQSDHCGFARAVRRAVGHSDHARKRGKVDDHATATLCAHEGDGFARRNPDAADIDADQFAPRRQIEIERRPIAAEDRCGIVDEDIEPPQSRMCLVHRRNQRRFIRHVHLQCKMVAAEFGRRCCSRRTVTVKNRDAVPLSGKSPGRCLADTGPAAGYYDAARGCRGHAASAAKRAR